MAQMHRVVSSPLHQHQMRAPSCHAHVPRSSPSSNVSAAALPKQLPRHNVFDIDAVVAGLHHLSTHWAFVAATAAFGDSQIPGSPQLYERYLQQLLPVTQHSYEAALLVRLLADEGIIGARSTSGREGPVVGRPIRHSGSRPLLIQEILEFWLDEIQPACLLRWCRQLGVTSQQLQQQIAEEYCKAQDQVEWQLLDTQGLCHGSSSSSSKSCSGTDYVLSSAADSSSSRRSAIRTAANTDACESPVATATRTAAEASSRVMLQQQRQQYGDVASPHIATAVVQPYMSVVQAITNCQQPVYIMSTYPADVATAALSVAGLHSSSSGSGSSSRGLLTVLQGRDIPECLQQLQQQQTQHAQQGLVSHPHDSSSSSSSRPDPLCVYICSSPSKASTVHAALSVAVDIQGRSQQQQQQQSKVSLQVGDWACSAPSLRAKALASSRMGLLADTGLAELLGVTDCDAVMDGIAWRG